MRVAAPTAGRGEIELPEEEFGDLILPVWQENASALHQVGFELAVSLPAPIRQIASPSHQIQIAQEDPQRYRVSLAPEADFPDRDLILDVRSKEALEGALTGVDKKGNGRFVAFIPSRRFGEVKDGPPRRVVFVLDRSGSMSGITIEQARRALLACLGALREADQFGIVAFDDLVVHFRDQLVPATRDNRDEAKRFLEGVNARGGTALAAGIEAGVRVLGGAAGDLLVITDGQVFGTEQVIARARATQTRVHCLGIGAASQDRFLAMLARETGATSRFLSFNERVDVEALALFAGIGRPAAEEVTVRVQAAGGAVAPEPPRHVFPGTPLVVHGSTAGPGEAALEIRWNGVNGREQLDLPLHIAESRFGEVLRLLTGARLLTDLENRYEEVDESHAATAVERRTQRRVSEQLEALSSEYGLASRAMALVAVVERPGDVTGRLPETRVVPVGLPQGVEFAAYFQPVAPSVPLPRAPASARLGAPVMGCPAPSAARHIGRLAWIPPRPARTVESPAPTASPADELLELLGRLEPDGGLPGRTAERRILASLFLLLRLVEEGGAPETRPYRIHIERLTEFVRTRMDALAPHQRRLVEAALEVVENGGRLEGEWKLSENFSTPKAWSRLSEALQKAGK
jgi:hypothetical protein